MHRDYWNDPYRIERNNRRHYSCEWLPDRLGHTDGVFSGSDSNHSNRQPDTRPPEVINQEKIEYGKKDAEMYFNSGCILLPRRYAGGKATRPEDIAFEQRMQELSGGQIYSPQLRSYVWRKQ